MGSLTIKNKALRCEKCFMLKKFTIEPNYPQTTISSECNCGFNRQSLLSFTDVLQKEELFKVKCNFCGKEPKHPSYCTGCRRTYCTTCKQAHDTTIQTKTPHKLIDSYKYDFYCSSHLDIFLSAYCKTCSLNICQNCINEKLHKGHRFIKYEKIILNPKDEENLFINLKKNEEKIETNMNRCNVIISQQKSHEKMQELKDVCNTTVRENRTILALIKYFYKLYTELKNKNYSIIFNVTENIKFNPQVILPENSGSLEQRTADFLEYLKRDYVLFKRFNAPKVRANTTLPNPQANLLNKKTAKPIEKKEENITENIKKFKSESINIIEKNEENPNVKDKEEMENIDLHKNIDINKDSQKEININPLVNNNINEKKEKNNDNIKINQIQKDNNNENMIKIEIENNIKINDNIIEKK